MRRQLRPFYGDEELRRLYSTGYDHTRWQDHVARVRWTADVLREMKPASVADLSCGDAAIENQAGLDCPVILGDLTGDYPYRGLIEHTIGLIPRVDVFVCCETLEHVRDPDLVLRLIRGKAERLLMTTPAGEADDANPEHLWGWTPLDMQAMLEAAGWQRDMDYPHDGPSLFFPDGGYYVFQMWKCR